MKTMPYLLPLVGLLLLGGCANSPRIAAPTAAVNPADATLAGIYDTPVSLTDGTYEGEPFMADSPIHPRVVLVPKLTLHGDLDDDNTPETVFFVEESSGGTGNFLYVAVLDASGGPAATRLVGDRIDIRGARLEAGRVVLEVVQGGPEDAACCPTQLARRSWMYRRGTVAELPPVIEGTLSLDTLDGSGWKLRQYGIDGTPVEVEITLNFADGGISGSSGCNQYHSGVEAGATPGDFSVGPLAATKRLCPGPRNAAEQRYLAALRGATHFSFFTGGLLVNYKVNGEYGMMRFDRTPASTE